MRGVLLIGKWSSCNHPSPGSRLGHTANCLGPSLEREHQYRKLERTLRRVTKKIKGLEEMTYKERLRGHNMQSSQEEELERWKPMLTVYKYLSNHNFKGSRGLLAVLENALIRSNGLRLRKGEMSVRRH